MLTQDGLNVFANWGLSLPFWALVAMVLLYFARTPAHRAIRSLCRALHGGLRLTARSILQVERTLVERNREVLLSAGAEAVETDLEREFQRVDAIVKRDVAAFPGLQRKLADQISLLEEDYQACTELPPPPPGWVSAVEAVAQLPQQSDAPVGAILEEIHKSTVSQFKTTLAEQRTAREARHAKLDRMMPRWRELADALREMGHKVTGLQERARTIDKHMHRYAEIRAGTDRARRVLGSSAMTQFFISAFVLLIAIGGAVINFNLIALPMSEMVGGGSYIGAHRTSDVAALVIILVEVAMGLYLMESLRITRLFPIIGQMDDRMRRRMAWITFGILFVLAGIESSLAFMRDRIAADMMALRQSLADVETVDAPGSMIPTVGQMVMGFLLPFALTFVAIPLESFVGSARTVIGAGLAVVLRWTAFVLRLTGNVCRSAGELLVNVYDVIVFAPLWLENRLRQRAPAAAPNGSAAAGPVAALDDTDGAAASFGRTPAQRDEQQVEVLS